MPFQYISRSLISSAAVKSWKVLWISAYSLTCAEETPNLHYQWPLGVIICKNLGIFGNPPWLSLRQNSLKWCWNGPAPPWPTPSVQTAPQALENFGLQSTGKQGASCMHSCVIPQLWVAQTYPWVMHMSLLSLVVSMALVVLHTMLYAMLCTMLCTTLCPMWCFAAHCKVLHDASCYVLHDT